MGASQRNSSVKASQPEPAYKAKDNDTASASPPQIHAPNAIPPNVIAWYNDRQRPKIDSGERSCIATLRLVMAATHPAPATNATGNAA